MRRRMALPENPKKTLDFRLRARPARHTASRWNGTAGPGRRSSRAAGRSGSIRPIDAAAGATSAAILWAARWIWKARASHLARKASTPVPTVIRRRAASSRFSSALRFRSRLFSATARRSAKRRRSSSGRMSGRIPRRGKPLQANRREPVQTEGTPLVESGHQRPARRRMLHRKQSLGRLTRLGGLRQRSRLINKNGTQPEHKDGLATSICR